MALTSKISPYDSRWPALFLSAKEQIAKAFGAELVAIHHVGSTAVPELAAKPEIDLLVEVAEHRNESCRDNVMLGFGYARGSDLSAGHHFYRRDVDGVRTHKTHVCITGHGQIERMLRFRDLLRSDPVLRQRYQDLKLELEANNTGGIGEYLAQKAPFIDGVIGSVRRDAAGCTRLATKACPVVLRTIHGIVHSLAFKHPVAGYQFVKGTIESGESLPNAAVRELSEESGICNARAVRDLGLWDTEFEEQIWSFQLCEVSDPLPDKWSFETDDDGGRIFEFFWHPLKLDLPEPCHRLFQSALVQIRNRVEALTT
ncbi:hypothetical protein PMI21_02082 [Pseudomonas sp. GM18]|nr:hypothetical protein PMI21_02082 [Pseudomonas sp. GM18]